MTSKRRLSLQIRLLNLKGNVVSPGASEAVRFEAVATPDIYGLSGRRSFYTSEMFVVRCADRRGKEAASHDPYLRDWLAKVDWSTANAPSQTSPSETHIYKLARRLQYWGSVPGLISRARA